MLEIDLPHSQSSHLDIERFGRSYGDMCYGTYAGYSILWPQDIYDWLVENNMWGRITTGREPAPLKLFSARFAKESDFTLFKLTWM